MPELAAQLLFIALLLALAALPLAFQSTQCFGFEHDEGLFLTISRQILNGQVLYKDAMDNKLPGLYVSLAPVVLGCGNSLFCIRTAAALLNFISALLLYFACRKYLFGWSGYVAPVAYLVLSAASMNVFFRSEFLLGHLFALSFFLLAFSLQKRNALFYLAAVPIAFGALIKPAFALVFVPVLYFLYVKSHATKRQLGQFAIAFAVSTFLLALAFSTFSDYRGFLSMPNGWLSSIAAHLSAAGFASFMEFAFFFILFFGFALALAFANFKSLSDFEKMCAVAFASVAILAVIFKSFSLTYNMLLFPLFFIPFSLLLASVASERMRNSRPGIDGAAALLPLLVFFAISAMAIYMAIPTPADHALATNHACLPCSAVMSQAARAANGSLFVYPSRAGLYYVFNALPFTRYAYHHELISSKISSPSWFESEVSGPLFSKQPNVVLLFDDQNVLVNSTEAKRRNDYLTATLPANYTEYAQTACPGMHVYVKKSLPAPAG